MANKMTKRDYFNKIKTMVTDADVIAFVDHEIELLDNKAARAANATRKPTKNQIANEAIKADILDYITDVADKVSIAMIADKFALTSQKVTPLVNALAKDGKVAKTVDKRTAFYTVA